MHANSITVVQGISQVFLFFFSMAQEPLVAKGSSLSRLHDHTLTNKHTQSVGLLWTNDRTDPENYLTTHDTQERQTSMSRGIRTRNPSNASSRRPTPLERAATVIGVIPSYKAFLANTTYCTLNVSF
jgi:hypothetical protein